MKKIKIDQEIGYWGVTAAWVTEQLDGITGDVEVILDSPGGDVFEGVQIYNAFREYDRGDVEMVINSNAASITSYIAMAGTRIKAKSNSSFMIHNVWTWAVGDHRDMRHTADVIEGLTGIVAAAYTARTGNTDEATRASMDDETWLFGQEIVDAGYADELIPVEDDTPRDQLLATSSQRFAACQTHTREQLDQLSPEDRAASMRACVQARDHPDDPTPSPAQPAPTPEPAAYAASTMARRFKLITGETL